MRKYRVRVQYVFEGYYDIKAEDREEAERIASEECGLVMGGNIHTSNDEQVTDWDFDTHPEERILPPRRRKQSARPGA